jgi:uncharacterized membrane protein YcaP (DUF421 family)
MIMFDSLISTLDSLFGLDGSDLSMFQMVARAIVVYPLGVAFVRLGEKRFIGKFTAFDVIMGIMIGSILARAVTGGSPFIPSLAAGLMLVFLHALFAALSFHFEAFGDIVKGSGRTLVRDGRIRWKAMRKSHISERDLMGAVRESGGLEDLHRVRLARLERSGNISVVRNAG